MWENVEIAKKMQKMYGQGCKGGLAKTGKSAGWYKQKRRHAK